MLVRLSWPFHGRTGQVDGIASRIASPDVAGAVVSGATGVGKTRTAREVLTAVERLGFETRWVVAASSASTVPLAAFTAWIPPSLTDTVQLLRGVIDAITTTAAGRPVVIGVDDAHLLDDLSMFVVHQLVQRRAATVILTVGQDDPIPTGLREIIGLGGFERLALQALSIDETSDVLRTALSGEVEAETAQRLWRLTDGNIMYLQNVVEHEIAGNRLVRCGPRWRWEGDPTLSPDLLGLVESRIGSLPGPVTDVLDVLAVADPLDLSVLSAITGPAAVEEAETLGVIAVDTAGGVHRARTAHPLYREVRRHRAPRTRLRRLRGRVATELGGLTDADDIHTVVQRASLMIDSDLEPTADLLMRAAHGAIWFADLSLAARLAEAAMAAGAGPEAGLIRAHALSWSGRGDEAETLLSATPTTGRDDTVEGRLAFLRASNMLWALGDPDRARQIIDDTGDLRSAEARSYIDAFRTIYWFATDRPHAAKESCRELRVDQLPPVVGSELAWVFTTMEGEAGRTGEAELAAEAGYAVATRSLDAPHMRFNIADAHVNALLLAGRIAEALDVAQRVQREARDLPGAAQLLGAAVVGRALLASGQLGTAIPILEHAVAGLSTTHASGWGYRYRFAVITGLAMRGEAGKAGAALELLEEIRRPFRSLNCERSLAWAWTAAARGTVTEAIGIALAGARTAAADGQFAAEVLCRQTAAQFGDHTTATRLRELCSIVEGPRVALAARFAEALQRGDAGELKEVALCFDELGDPVAAIDANALAAVVYRSRELRGSALACATAASAAAERCGAVTPALRQAAEPVPLTAREREMVMLIGQGMSNRQVAQALTLSVRTVESHIYRAMAKTGTTNRAELAALLSGGAPLPDKTK